MQFVTLACIIIMKGRVMLKIKIKINDVVQASKNKNTSLYVSSLISPLPEHPSQKNILPYQE